MGTRHITEVKLGGELKISHYGQWDGYPNGQGKTIAKFLATVDLNQFKKQVLALKEYTNEAIEQAYLDAGAPKGEQWISSDIADKVKAAHPALSRDVGAGILQLIHEGVVTRIVMETEFKKDTLMCEYVYTVDLDKETVTVGTHTYSFAEWTESLMEEIEYKNAKGYRELITGVRNA